MENQIANSERLTEDETLLKRDIRHCCSSLPGVLPSKDEKPKPSCGFQREFETHLENKTFLYSFLCLGCVGICYCNPNCSGGGGERAGTAGAAGAKSQLSPRPLCPVRLRAGKGAGHKEV